MKVNKTLPNGFNILNGAEIYYQNYLAVAAAYCRRLGLVEIINQMVGSQMELQPGLVVQAMVLDTLSGRTPLYRVEKFMAEQDIELLLGTSASATLFNDTNLSRALDAIFKAGPSKIITELGIRAVKEFALDIKTISYDTTSTNVWGDYQACENPIPPPGPVITFGFSKDHHPELKQFMTELLCVERGIPLFSRIIDGNSSDKKSNNKILTQISSIMARHGLGPGAFVYVADSAMVTHANLDVMGDNRFITRLPATYNECERVINEAVASNSWIDLGTLAQIPTKGKRPCAIYKVFESSLCLYGNTYRALVVHSSSHDKRRQKKLVKIIRKSEKDITKQLAQFCKVYFCEADAKVAAKQAEGLSDKLHLITTNICPIEVRKPGRPTISGSGGTVTRFTLSCELAQNTEAIERENQKAGCFVLLSNVPIKGEGAIDSRKLLETYRGQYGVESDFAFLKDPLVVNDIFLKKPWRIDALGMIFVLALMIWRLMERSMRVYLKDNQKTVIGWCRRDTDKPTAFMMTTVITGIMTAIIKRKRILLTPLEKHKNDYLVALGIEAEVFLNPKYKCHPIIPLQLIKKG